MRLILKLEDKSMFGTPHSRKIILDAPIHIDELKAALRLVNIECDDVTAKDNKPQLHNVVINGPWGMKDGIRYGARGDAPTKVIGEYHFVGGRQFLNINGVEHEIINGYPVQCPTGNGPSDPFTVVADGFSVAKEGINVTNLDDGPAVASAGDVTMYTQQELDAAVAAAVAAYAGTIPAAQPGRDAIVRVGDVADDVMRGERYGEYITVGGFPPDTIPAAGEYGYERRAYYVDKHHLDAGPDGTIQPMMYPVDYGSVHDVTPEGFVAVIVTVLR